MPLLLLALALVPLHGASARPCTLSQVRLRLVTQGAAGSRIGELTATSLGGSCTLRGRPTVRVLATRPVRTALAARPGAARTVVVAPGRRATSLFRWSNWCGGRVHGVVVSLPGDGAAIRFGFPEPPPCLGRGQPSTVEVGAFERAT